MENIDYSKVTDNPKVIELLKARNEIEKQIREIEQMALVKYELEYLSLEEQFLFFLYNVVVSSI